MISRKKLNQLHELFMDQVNILEMDMLINISKLFNATDGIDESNIDKWYESMIIKNASLSSAQRKVIKKYEKIIFKEISELYSKIGFETMDHDEKLFKKAVQQGILSTNPAPYTESNAVLNVLKSAIKNAEDKFNLIKTSALESSSREYLSILSKVQLEVSTGVRDYNSAIRSSVRQLADKGIAGVTYETASGLRRMNMESAARLQIVTPTVQATGNMQLERMEEYGGNHVEVSSHIGARPSHAVWQGKVYMVNGSNQRYRNLTEATNYGSVDGLQGANCRHFFYSFVPGVSERTYKPYPKKANEKAYKLQQQQRKLERSIKSEKRRSVLLNQIGDSEGFEKSAIKLKDKRNNLDQFLKDTGRTQQSRLFVHGFNKKLSAKSVAVANKSN